jgi:hypothetical protein
MAIPALIPVLAPIIDRVVGNLFPDPTEKAKAQAEAMRELVASHDDLQKAAASIIQTEAASSHWLAANWRPLTMIVFVGLIVARWCGWAAPNLEPAEYLKLWDIVEFGLGGYTVGRSVEKIAPMLADAMRGRQ